MNLEEARKAYFDHLSKAFKEASEKRDKAEKDFIETDRLYSLAKEARIKARVNLSDASKKLEQIQEFHCE